MGDLTHDHMRRPSDQDEQHDGEADVEDPIEQMSEPFVFEKAEDINLPLIGIRQAVEQDHENLTSRRNI